jgi:hypothetical protein
LAHRPCPSSPLARLHAHTRRAFGVSCERAGGLLRSLGRPKTHRRPVASANATPPRRRRRLDRPGAPKCCLMASPARCARASCSRSWARAGLASQHWWTPLGARSREIASTAAGSC